MKDEVKSLDEKFSALTDEEQEQVTGGGSILESLDQGRPWFPNE